MPLRLDGARACGEMTRYNPSDKHADAKRVLDDAMTKKVHFTRVIWGYLVASLAVFAIATQATAAGPVQQAYFEPDYEASGFVIPAGMPSPDAYFQPVQQAGFFGRTPIASRLGGGQAAHGCQGCDGCQGCSGMGGYGPDGYPMGDYGYGDGSCQGGCGAGGCGLLGGCGLFGCGGCGHGCLSRLRSLCLFCGGSGCGVCQSIGRGYLLGALRSLLPHGGAGIGAQRWYDLSADLMFLEVSGGASDQVVATRGESGTPVLRANDADDDYTVGGRISGAFIFGPGGNIEVTYLGGNRWSGEGIATGDGDLFSFLSEFGTLPPGGFAETDASDFQRVASEATFHSGEVNYRRRTVGPYGRFQWSGLGGIRYLRFDSGFEYDTAGNGEFFSLNNTVQNEMVGVQTGGDLWWNVVPGINLGVGVKGGPMGNRIKRRSAVDASSIAGEVVSDDYISRTSWMSELEATALYRLSHSWTLKGQYYVLHVDRVGDYGFDTAAADAFIAVTPIDPINTRSLTIRGFTIGAEYIW